MVYVRDKKAFTLINLLIVIVIIAILATLGSPVYFNAIENAKAKVCATNLKALGIAVESYGLENGALPGSLSKLPPRDIKRAWVKVFKNDNPFAIKIAYFLVDFDKKGAAFAASQSFSRFLGGDVTTFICPADVNGYPSYGINSALVNPDGSGISWSSYKSLPADNWIIADCDADICASSLKRHKYYQLTGSVPYGQEITKDKTIKAEIVIPFRAAPPARYGSQSGHRNGNGHFNFSSWFPW